MTDALVQELLAEADQIRGSAVAESSRHAYEGGGVAYLGAGDER